MRPDQRFCTSPMLFGYRGSTGRLRLLDACTGQRLRFSDGRGSELALAFLSPRSVISAEAEGFSRSEIEAALQAGLIVDEQECDRLALWEQAGWSRAAYLMFSQTNLDYAESGADQDLGALTDRRREQVTRYGSVEEYPGPRLLSTGPKLVLPPPRDIEPGLSALTSRRSVRAFSSEPPDVEQLATVLHWTTSGLRLIASDRAGGDPFRLLNSMYSWAHFFVVVQHVRGAAGGIYEYDWSEHVLRSSVTGFDEADLLACVQGQRWILGTGFAIFVVADLRGYAWLYRHARAYIHMLIQLGELGQDILTMATALGLGGWTTPAVHESRSAALLGVPDEPGIEVLWVVKLGCPLRRRGASAGLPEAAPG